MLILIILHFLLSLAALNYTEEPTSFASSRQSVRCSNLNLRQIFYLNVA